MNIARMTYIIKRRKYRIWHDRSGNYTSIYNQGRIVTNHFLNNENGLYLWSLLGGTQPKSVDKAPPI